MPKVTIAITIDEDQYELLSEIRSKYHLKNMSTAVHSLIKRYQLIAEDRTTAQKNTVNPPEIPVLQAIPVSESEQYKMDFRKELPDKYKLKLWKNKK